MAERLRALERIPLRTTASWCSLISPGPARSPSSAPATRDCARRRGASRSRSSTSASAVLLLPLQPGEAMFFLKNKEYNFIVYDRKARFQCRSKKWPSFKCRGPGWRDLLDRPGSELLRLVFPLERPTFARLGEANTTSKLQTELGTYHLQYDEADTRKASPAAEPRGSRRVRTILFPRT